MDKAVNPATARAKSLARCAMAMAIMTVAAWVTIPFGPVPYTLQPIGILFALFALRPKEALASIAGYLLLGALGLPVFTSFRGGLAALMGPTGGFWVGYLVGGALALAVAYAVRQLPVFSRQRKRAFLGVQIASGRLAVNLLMGVVFLAVIYLFGWAWLMMVGNLSPEAAFMASVAPFVVVDAIKMLVAVALGQAVGSALRG